MLKAFKLVACTVFFSTACLIPPSKGAFEPWASNTDPTDVPKSQVQEVTTSPFTYNITQVQHAGRGHGHHDAHARQPHPGQRVGFGARPRPDQTHAPVWNSIPLVPHAAASGADSTLEVFRVRGGQPLRVLAADGVELWLAQRGFLQFKKRRLEVKEWRV